MTSYHCFFKIWNFQRTSIKRNWTESYHNNILSIVKSEVSFFLDGQITVLIQKFRNIWWHTYVAHIHVIYWLWSGYIIIVGFCFSGHPCSCLCVHLSICLSVFLFALLSAYRSIYHYVCLSVCQSRIMFTLWVWVM